MTRRRTIVMALLFMVGFVLSFGVGCNIASRISSGMDSRLDVVSEVWDIISEDYVDRENLDASALSEAAIRGMVEALDDPYTSYLDKETYQMSSAGLEGRYEGIGAYVGVRDEQIVIIAPIMGSPAAEAGIAAGDIILEIDGVSVVGTSVEETAARIRGPKGTAVKLLILHEGETEAEVIEIIRAEVTISSVYFEMRSDIAYINIRQFSEPTSGELSSVLESVTLEDAAGIILDLRSNPGGLLDTVVNVASRFLENGVVVHVVDNRGREESLSVNSGGITTNLPMVVLVDSYSASASEVLAGALQDHGRAIIAGNTTYGKGSVNALYHLSDGSGLYLTTARWLTPDGRLIEGKGITPDYKLELEGEDATQWALDYLKDNK